MVNYAAYTRSVEGQILGIGYVVFDSKLQLSHYPHAQPLVGQPERNVFWDNPSGLSIDVTPYERESTFL